MEDFFNIFVGSAVVSLIIALSAFFLFRSRHTTVRPKHSAGSFIKDGSLRFTLRKDTFVSTYTTRVKRSSGSSGGSGMAGSMMGSGA